MSVGGKRSGYARLIGYRVTRWEPDFAEVTLDPGPQHRNRGGNIHGGVLTTLLDTACGYAGCHSAIAGEVRSAVTLSLAASFLAPAGAGPLTAVARRTGGGRTVFFANAEIRDGAGTVVAYGEGVFRYRERDAGRQTGRQPAD
jgi:uncharacterized protein (TIGR00369 family)